MKKFNINQVLCIIIIILLVVLIYKQTIRNEQFYSVDCSKQDIEKLSGTKGDGYRGCQNRTVSGRLCQKWTEQTPHEHRNRPSKRPGTGLGDHNYCRNPGRGGPTIWCYTTDSKERWECCKPKPDTPPTKKAEFYTEKNYGGLKMELPVGELTSSCLTKQFK